MSDDPERHLTSERDAGRVGRRAGRKYDFLAVIGKFWGFWRISLSCIDALTHSSCPACELKKILPLNAPRFYIGSYVTRCITSQIERRIWDLLVLVSEQQVTQTRVRLRRQDIHRKLLDTSLYSYYSFHLPQARPGRLSLVINRVAGRSILLAVVIHPPAPFAGGARRVPVQFSATAKLHSDLHSSEHDHRCLVTRPRHVGGSASSSTKRDWQYKLNSDG